jgi:hypothetical protein
MLLRLSWTGASGYLQIIMTAVVTASLACRLRKKSTYRNLSVADLDVSPPKLADGYPVLFEACKETSPTEAGIDFLGPSCSFGLISIVAGVVVKKSGNYVIPTYVGWVLAVVSAGLLTTFTRTAVWPSLSASSLSSVVVLASFRSSLCTLSSRPSQLRRPLPQWLSTSCETWAM